MNKLQKEISRRRFAIADVMVLQQRSQDRIAALQQSYSRKVVWNELCTAGDQILDFLFGWIVGHEKETLTMFAALGLAVVVGTMIMKSMTW